MGQSVTDIVKELESNPYQIIPIYATYSGVLHYGDIHVGDTVFPAMGKWQEIPPTVLATITRERIHKAVVTQKKAIVEMIFPELEAMFVQAGTQIMTLKHYYSKEEVLEIVLKHSLSLFCAPERAKYYFIPEIEKKITAFGSHSVHVHEGMPLFIMSRMKREVTLDYSGPSGIIYSIYCQPSQNIDVNTPLIGVCEEAMLPDIEEIVSTIQCRWQD